MLRGGFRGSLEEGIPLAGFTTFRIGGPAGLLARPQGTGDLGLLLEAVAASQERLLVLGKGSNVLISDQGFDGVVAVLSGGLGRITKDSKDKVYVESGCDLNMLVRWVIERDLGGLEDLSGIPGSVGGAVRMNAGAMGASIGDRVERVDVMRLAGAVVETKEMKRRDMGFEYRRSGLEDGDIICGIWLKLEPAAGDALKSRRREVMRWRRENQPLRQPSAGSVFRNPPGAAAGELIDRCGLKGMRMGEAMVSDKHANFIVNTGGARADDVHALMMRVKEEVKRREGIELEEEIRLVGVMGEGGR